MQSVPGVGPITTATFLAAIDTPTRFASAPHVAAHLGLVPREWSSGERQHRGVTKTVLSIAENRGNLDVMLLPEVLV